MLCRIWRTPLILAGRRRAADGGRGGTVSAGRRAEEAHTGAVRTTVRLTPDRLDDLRAAQVPCAACLRWELDPRAARAGARRADAAAEKDAWLSTVLREWGSCGRVLLVDGAPVGYLVYAPAAFVPGADGFATAPGRARRGPAHHGPRRARRTAAAGLGRVLVQAMAADLIERGGVRAVEAFGTSHGAAARRLVPGARRLPGRGRVPHRAARTPPTPRMRMDLRSALTWREEVEAALGRLVGAVRPEAVGAPRRPAGRRVAEAREAPRRRRGRTMARSYDLPVRRGRLS